MNYQYPPTVWAQEWYVPIKWQLLTSICTAFHTLFSSLFFLSLCPITIKMQFSSLPCIDVMHCIGSMLDLLKRVCYWNGHLLLQLHPMSLFVIISQLRLFQQAEGMPASWLPRYCFQNWLQTVENTQQIECVSGSSFLCKCSCSGITSFSIITN